MVEQVHPLSILLWAVALMAASMYPIGMMLGAPCGKCCSGRGCRCGVVRLDAYTQYPVTFYENQNVNDAASGPGRWCCDKTQPLELTLRVSSANVSNQPFVYDKYEAFGAYEGGYSIERGSFARKKRITLTHDCSPINGDYVLPFNYIPHNRGLINAGAEFPFGYYVLANCGYLASFGFPRIWITLNSELQEGSLPFPQYSVYVQFISGGGAPHVTGSRTAEWYWFQSSAGGIPYGDGTYDEGMAYDNVYYQPIRFGNNIVFYSVFGEPACDLSNVPDTAVVGPIGQRVKFVGNHYENDGSPSPGQGPISFSGEVQNYTFYTDVDGLQIDSVDPTGGISGAYPACNITIEVL